MTQQSDSAAPTPSRTPLTEAAAPTPSPFPRLAAPRPLAQRRVWPRTFHDRLTAPLPGLRAFARFAREGAIRPGREGLA
ncbi:MBL fold metallo-hydrolase, partial [Streptomyces nigra]